MKYFYIESKSDDYGANNNIVIKARLKEVKNIVYYYTEIPEEDYIILKKYLGDFDEYFDREQLEDYFG